MSNPASSPIASDRNLLFGMLGLQKAFFHLDDLTIAMEVWTQDKTKLLGQILLERGDLSSEKLRVLEAMVDDYVLAHGDDPQCGLATLPASVVAALRRMAGDDVDARGDRVAMASTIGPSSPEQRDHARGLPVQVDGIGEAETAGRYRLLHSHARGGLGEVFVAEDDEVRRQVALKRIQEQYADNPESRVRFLREAEITGGLEHPGIVPVYGLGHYADGRPFYAMRFVRGESFKEAIDRFHEADRRRRDPGERILELRQLLNRFIAVCNTMAYAHSRGVLHRDLKPANVMLGNYGETLVVDWGLAKQFDRTDGERVSGETTLPPASGSGPEGATQAGHALGTPAFMSPEQAAGRGDMVGPASDIYSLGAMLYTLLTGRPPFCDPIPELILFQVMQGALVPPRQVKPGVARALEAICLKAMARQPSDRYQSARALAVELEQWLADEPVAAHRQSLWERTTRLCRHRPVYAAGMGFLVAMDLLVCGVIIALVYGQAALSGAIYVGISALVFLPFVVLFLAQVWWLVGAIAGAFLGSRGALSGGLIGFVAGGSIGWLSPMSMGGRALGTMPGPEFVIAPLAGAVLGILPGTLVAALWARAKKRTLLSALLGSALGFIGGSLVVAASAGDASGIENALPGMIAGALAGVALGTIAAAFPGNPRRVAVGASIGAIVGTLIGVALLIFATNGDVTLLIAGGLAGAALGTFSVGCRGEARKKAVWRAFMGGRVGLAGGTILFAVLLWFGLHSLPGDSALPWLALPVILVPPALDVGLGLMNRARLETLLTRATRGAVIGAVVGGSVTLTLFMATAFSQFSSVAGKQPANLPAPAGGGMNPAAQDPFQTLISMQEKLVRENPKITENAVVLGSFYSAQATLARDQGNTQNALVQFDKAIATLQAVVENEPRHVKARELLRDSHSGRAVTLVRLNRSAEALAEWDRALELDTWPSGNEFRLQRALALARLGEHAKATMECDALAKGKNLSAATLVTLARVYARSAGAVRAGQPKGSALPAADRQKLGEHYAARAVAALVEAEAAGYFKMAGKLDELKTSTDFEPLRSREDFKSLLGRV